MAVRRPQNLVWYKTVDFIQLCAWHLFRYFRPRSRHMITATEESERSICVIWLVAGLLDWLSAAPLQPLSSVCVAMCTLARSRRLRSVLDVSRSLLSNVSIIYSYLCPVLPRNSAGGLYECAALNFSKKISFWSLHPLIRSIFEE